MIDGAFVEVLLGDDFLDDFLLELFAKLLGGDIRPVLSADDHGVHPLGDDSAAIMLVLNGDLGLGVGSQPGASAVQSGFFHGSVEFVG